MGKRFIGNVKGTGVDSVEMEFYLSSSGTTMTGGEWVSTPPTLGNNKYLWIRYKFTLTNDKTEYTTPYCDGVWEEIYGIYEVGENITGLQNDINTIKSPVNNNTVVEDKNGVTSIPVVAAEYLGSTQQTGKLIIKLPQGFVGTMVKFTVEILEKYGKTLAEYDVFGQIYSGGFWSTVSNAWCRGVGDKIELPVAFGSEGDKTAITIGNADTVWDIYSAIKIKDLTAYFTHFDVDEWASGWDISIGNATGTYTITRQTYELSQETMDMFEEAGYPIIGGGQ